MASIVLLHLKDCPWTNTAINTLKSLNLGKCTKLIQDELPENDKYKKYSSPSILINDILVYGRTSSGPSCSVHPPSATELKRIITEIFGDLNL